MMDAKLEEAWRFHRSGDYERAEALYRAVIQADPRNFTAFHRLGFLYGQRGQWEAAQSAFGRAIDLNPTAADAYFLRGTALNKLMREDEAVRAFDRAIALAPPFAEAVLNRAAALFRLRRYEEASADYDRLLGIDPDFPFARGNRLFCRLHCCDWSSLEEDFRAVIAGLAQGKRVIAPFDAKTLPLDPEQELRCAEIWARDQYPSIPEAIAQSLSSREKIRVAYLSADFRETPVANLMAEVFELHDRKRFETIAVSFGPDDRSAMRTRLERAFDSFIDVTNQSDGEVARLLRERGVDIAVDLMGLTEGSRAQIFRHRAAPVQILYLGYPGTGAIDELDYIFADRIVVPEEQLRFYSEKVVYLPESFMPRDTTHGLSMQPTRAEARLPESAFVFACFNNTYKITPAMFDVWMRILAAVPGSVLWLPQVNAVATRNLLKEANARGIESTRLLCAERTPLLEDHLARLSLADLFLDTFPYNAHSTASDALWAGVPVLTRLGSTFAGRVAASLLHAADLKELVSETIADYESTALKLAHDRTALSTIRAKLARNRGRMFDPLRFTSWLEAAFIEMNQRRARGEPAASFSVAALSDVDQRR